MTVKKTTPKISVIIPLFNREQLIPETLESLLSQTFENWECIIVDDHSIDKGFSVVKNFSQQDSRFKCYLRPEKLKKGANSCRNFGLSKSHGEFIYWLDSDDIPHPNLLEYALRCLKGSCLDYVRFKRKLFYGKFEQNLIEDKKLKPGRELIPSPDLIEAMLLNELEFNTCNVVWRRNSLSNQRFCENIVYADEWEYYSRLLIMGLKGQNLENILIFGRKHKNSTTAEYSLKSSVRVASKIKAVQMVLKNLNENKLFTPRLKSYFLRLGFEVKSFNIIKLSLKAANAGMLEKWKYKIGYQFYPVLKPIFYLKGKILKS
ncbi:glycosyltransferase family 2 protein [Salegentibacter sediminis]|uniref:glycosyltransferase family 2 protein n=1 Tax=Salegentibacter sediminis TaxID=1930251 RepID=UPI0009BF6427|nr:glycosyltransferase family 2 protein [Salegentibacter sediminis]